MDTPDQDWLFDDASCTFEWLLGEHSPFADEAVADAFLPHDASLAQSDFIRDYALDSSSDGYAAPSDSACLERQDPHSIQDAARANEVHCLSFSDPSEPLIVPSPAFRCLNNPEVLSQDFDESAALDSRYHFPEVAGTLGRLNKSQNIRDSAADLEHQQSSPKALRTQQPESGSAPADNSHDDFFCLKRKHRSYDVSAQEISPLGGESDSMPAMDAGISGSWKHLRLEQNDVQQEAFPRMKRPRILGPFAAKRVRKATTANNLVISASKQDTDVILHSNLGPKAQKSDSVDGGYVENIGRGLLKASLGRKVRNAVARALELAGWGSGRS